MKKSHVTVLVMVAVCAVLQCVNRPTVVEEEPHVPGNAVPVTVSDFDARMAASRVALVEFFSEKCAVCASLTWVIDSLHAVFSKHALVGANNIDSDTLHRRFALSSVPTYIFFKDGKVVARRSFINNDPSVYDTLAVILKWLLADTLPPDYRTLDGSTFDSLVLRKGTTAMVFFQCAGGDSCIAMDSVVRQLVPRFEGKAIVARVRTWENTTLCSRYGVSNVPQFLFFKDSIHLEELRITGTVEGDTLAAVLERLLADSLLPDYLTLDETTFDSTVLRKGTTAMVLFLYPFCLPCASMDSVVRKILPAYEGRAVIARVFTTNNFTLCDRYGIADVPQILFFKDSLYREELRKMGIVEGDTLAATLERLLAEPLPDRVTSLNKSTFGDSVNITGRVAMIDFFLPTCRACQNMTATVSELADTFYRTALIAKVDCSLDDSLDEAFGVQLVPTFVFLKGGVEYYRCTGNFPFDTLAAYIRKGMGGTIATKPNAGNGLFNSSRSFFQ